MDHKDYKQLLQAVARGADCLSCYNFKRKIIGFLSGSDLPATYNLKLMFSGMRYRNIPNYCKNLQNNVSNINYNDVK